MSAKILRLVGEKLVQGGAGGAATVVDSASVLKDKLLALYFSAHWCPPCRQFTPEFAKVYTSLQAAGKPFAVVFVSADQDQEAFNDYFATQPWYAVPYEASDVRERLNEEFGIRGIPALLVLTPEGELLSKEGRSDVVKLKEKAFDNWQQKVQKAH